MRALVWVTENTWEPCVDRVRLVVDHAPCQVLLVWTVARHRNLNPGGGAR
jgi:hypothetical protein